MGCRPALPAPPAHERVAVREGTDDVRDLVGGARAAGPGEAQSAEQLVATYSDLKPADLANTLLDLPDERMIEVAEELSDERLADALEEMPEDEQVHILEQLGDERAADILDAMEPDDAADLLGQLPEERSEQLLDLMEPEEAEDVRALLQYGPDTAGGLMTSEPIVLSADATVAEALALIRRHELHPALAAAVFVTLPPYETPTGRLLGTVHFQRMLRYPPHERLGAIIDDTLDPVPATASAAEVARMLASYNLVSLPVVDQAHRLVGAVSVDDVLDYLLPDDWRSHGGDDEPPAPAVAGDATATHPEEALMARPSRQPSLDAPRGRSGMLQPQPAALARPVRPVLRGVRARDGHLGVPHRHDRLRRGVAAVEHVRAACSCSSTRGRRTSRC